MPQSNPSTFFDITRSQYQDKALFDQAKSYAFEYLKTIHNPAALKTDDRPVYPDPDTLNALDTFDEPFPKELGNGQQILEMLHTIGSPATVAQTGGRYFGFVNGAAFPAALAAKWLADVWDQNAAMNVTSPVAAKLEAVCESWLKEIFNLPDSTVAGFVSGTSAATLCGLLAARNRILANMGWDVREKGLFDAPKPRVILGEQAHSTVFKALSLIGFGSQDLELIPVDSHGRMKVDQLPDIDETCLVIAQAGNVNTGAFDNFYKICDRASRAWVHVDGAFGLWAAGSPSYAHLTRGMEKADSWSVDAHKTLNAPYDCGIVLCRHPEDMITALQNTGDYIIYSDKRDPMLYTPEMSRRARGIDLWATLKYLGKSGLASLVDHLCDMAKLLGKDLKNQGFTIHNDVEFNQVLLSCPKEETTKKMLDLIQADGTCWCGNSMWQGKTAIRISVCSWATTKADVAATAQAFIRARKKAEKQN